MKITLYKDTQIYNKVHKAGNTLCVFPEIGKELCRKGIAGCVDQSYDIPAIRYTQKSKKKINPKK